MTVLPTRVWWWAAPSRKTKRLYSTILVFFRTKVELWNQNKRKREAPQRLQRSHQDSLGIHHSTTLGHLTGQEGRVLTPSSGAQDQWLTRLTSGMARALTTQTSQECILIGVVAAGTDLEFLHQASKCWSTHLQRKKWLVSISQWEWLKNLNLNFG